MTKPGDTVTCARCGARTTKHAHLWRDGTNVYYCHDDEHPYGPSCYTMASALGFPELAGDEQP